VTPVSTFAQRLFWAWGVPDGSDGRHAYSQAGTVVGFIFMATAIGSMPSFDVGQIQALLPAPSPPAWLSSARSTLTTELVAWQ
jgi:hypothetical protein